ncbi:PLD nuclease N-terminal domain-containing protein [Phytoactinopolyspora halotolerans]|uniref:PLDc_N domain-containing protein n=1 Tax=Phytoactinopolyspora halotolerans TaxID=1981512 RepID=A0A6L9S6D4_9ACTN|nr:PLD nuclease N-terminal domain-containing protein [Phytoactinopolyspora halotolerans]NEE00321.1 PLDc_N domain-containing protein [Phytoactinopolyspora halotolerans]
MTRVLPVLVTLVLAVYTFIDCLQTDAGRIRSLNKPVWLAIVVLIPVVGPILWLTVGKTREPRPGPVHRPPPPQQLPPDDNPEFLRELRNLDDEHEKLLSEWEESLRRREEEMRSQEGEKGEDDKQKPDDSDPPDEPKSQEDLDKAEEELRKQRGDRGDDDGR